jgi:hypothetical protein
MTYEYRGREIKIEQVTGVRAEIPSVKTAVQLAPASGAAVRGSVAEGHLFSPYFTLTLTQTCRSGQRSVSCLTLNSIG